MEEKVVTNRTIPIGRNVEFFLKIISLINEIWFDFSKYFDMIEFSDANH